LEPAVAVVCALGNYPQQVRQVNALLAGAALQWQAASNCTDRPELVAWAKTVQGDGARLLAAGILRLAGQLTAASELLAQPVAASWISVRNNELASLAWQQGDLESAQAVWQSLPSSAPVAFNLGLSFLVGGELAKAMSHFKQAAAQLPESNAWHHLAELYAIVASQA
ncbi:MAG: hypothetical protein SNJ75_16345, partial [Gemmataceae bacterium]